MQDSSSSAQEGYFDYFLLKLALARANSRLQEATGLLPAFLQWSGKPKQAEQSFKPSSRDSLANSVVTLCQPAARVALQQLTAIVSQHQSNMNIKWDRFTAAWGPPRAPVQWSNLRWVCCCLGKSWKAKQTFTFLTTLREIGGGSMLFYFHSPITFFSERKQNTLSLPLEV